jgi:hypothetical protein
MKKMDTATFDLFEFIDENPEIDEPVGSYIFRQVWLGVCCCHVVECDEKAALFHVM